MQLGAQVRLSFYRLETGQNLRLHVEDDRIEAVKLLAGANLESLKARYPDSNGAADWINAIDNDADYILRCVAESRRLLMARRPPGYFTGRQGGANLYMMCRCYEYQSCEHDGWNGSDAQRLADCLAREGVRIALFDEIEAAPWGYTEPEPEAGEEAAVGPVLLSLL